VKNLYIIMAHIDDFECSCLGYVNKHQEEYNKICLVVCSYWENKKNIFTENLKLINSHLKAPIAYVNLNFKQRRLNSEIDNLKDDIYKLIDFSREFDILTHDKNDLHTDHVAVHNIARGMYKHCSKYISVYSPSSSDFKPNYFIALDSETYGIKKTTMDKYSMEVEQSYSKSGYYLQSEEHYNIGRSYVLENFVNVKNQYFEIYRICKWLQK
tara:strand:- start:1698 stop:2333 length:636 start_codon:yes stop_codon:yes gene_type:complete